MATATAAAAAPAPATAQIPPDASQHEPEDPVQRTCSGACALRAVELLRRGPSALISDRLALRMAGPRMLGLFSQRWDAWEAAEGPGKHSYFAGRARVLDEIVEEAAAKLAGSGDLPGSGGQGGGGGDSGGSAPAAIQIVSLGCGMDTRPWRLERLPPGTAWFDVDQAPVLRLKRRFLREAGAQLGAAEVVEEGDGGPPAVGGGGGGASGVESSRAAEAEAPALLKCASYHQVVADLEQPGLPGLLAAAGFDPSLPTAWVLEGLCYYLSEAANARVLAEAAAASPRGSRLIATHIPRENLEANRSAPPGAISGLFTVCIEDVLASGALAAAGWGGATVSCDVAGVVRARCGGAECYYPYSLEYSGGKPLAGIECILEAERGG